MTFQGEAAGNAEGGRNAQPPRVAVIGCGHWGRNLVRNFCELGTLAAICEREAASAAQISRQYDVPVLSLAGVLEDWTIDAVAIAAPAAQHFTLAQAALEAGKHVFVEKPLSLSVEDAERLCALAEERGRTLMVGHLLQYHPAFLALRDCVRNGELGRIQYIYSNRLNLGRFRREEDILWSFAPHDISMILSLVGTEPERVEAVGSYYLHGSIADVTTTHLMFPGGEQAHVFVSWLHPFKEQKLVVVGDKAMAVFDDSEAWARKLLLYRHKIEWRDTFPVPQKGEAEAVGLQEGEPLRLECAHFLDCVQTGKVPRTDGREGARVLRVLTRASQALKAGKPKASAEPKVAHQGVQIHESAYVDEPTQIGEGTRIWHFSHVLANSKIGQNCNIGQNVSIGPDVKIGDRCKIQNNVSVYKGVTLEENVFCGPSCVFTNVSVPRAEIERKSEFKPTLVKRGASIGANATIVCGNTLGEYCLIAAGAVVTSDVPAYALMAGVPARRIGWVSRAGHRLGPDLVCPGTGARYREVGPNAIEEIAGEKVPS